MNDQAKIERTIKLLLLLSCSFGYAIDEISERFNISNCTVYRYIETFRNAGLVIENINNITHRP